jgi:hypothetical protein
VRGHPGSETIAAFRDDLLPARKAARIAVHLRECPRCAEVDAQLAAVTASLARTPAPPMPASLAARLDAALAAEVAARSAAGAPAGSADGAAAATPAGPAGPVPAGPAGPDRAASPAARARRGPGTGPGHTGPGHTGPGRGGPGRGGPGRRAGRPRAGSRLSLRIAAVAAAVVVLAGGGYAIVRVVSAGGQGTSATSSGAAASGNAEGRPSGPTLAPEAAPRAPAASLPLVASGTRYRAGQLPAQVAAVLKRYPAHGHIGAAPPAAAGTAAFPHLAGCVSHVAGRQRPRLVDIAHYGTRPAAVIVVPVPRTTGVHVTVAGPGCSGQGGDIITQFSMPAPG